MTALDPTIALAPFAPATFPSWTVPDPDVVVELPGGLELVSGSSRSAPLSLAEWDGWDNGARVKSSQGSWDDDDGGWETPMLFDGRDLTFSGRIRGQNPRHMWLLKEKLAAVGIAPRWGTIIVREQHLGLSRQVRAKRAAKPVITPLSDRIAAYQLQFETADWRRLSTDARSVTITSAGVALENLGTAPAKLTVTLTGPLTNPAGLAWDDGAWQYGAVVPAGETRTVDFERRRVSNLATTLHSRIDAAGTWLSLPPESTTVIRRTGGGTGTISAAWRSSWG
ncbi:hypothetical protein ACXET9_07320 [Brachybacterium sp. DNPG3]